MKKNLKVILSIESSRASGRDYLRGIARYAHLNGAWSFYWEPGGLEMTRQTLKVLDADGIIMRDVGAMKSQVLRSGLPAVVLGHRDREMPGLINVLTDSKAIGQMAAEHLRRVGFQHFAFCGLARRAAEQTPWSQKRLESFAQHLRLAKFETPPAFILPPSGSDWKKKRRELADWLLKLSHPVGLLACNDDCGAQVAEACKLAGLRVSEDVGIVGVDNDEVVCGLTDPPMSSVAMNFERAGFQAAEALNQLMQKTGKLPNQNISVQATHVVSRRSTDKVAVGDLRLAKVLRHLRDRAQMPLSVNEVAKVAGISRRTLERRFQQHLGGSIHKEIRRHRTDAIARFLLETDLPVAKIAETMGFADAQHFARYFRAAKKSSPSGFRKKFGKVP